MKKIKYFNKTSEEYGFFCNFYKPIKLIINNESWDTSESYFQAMKFRDEKKNIRRIEYYNIIKNCDSPMKAKMLGTQNPDNRFAKKWKINKNTDNRLVVDIINEYKDITIRRDWEKIKDYVMINVIVEKFLQNKDLLFSLNIDNNMFFIENTKRDIYWGDGGDGGTGKIGKNKLGKIITKTLEFLI